MTPPRCLSWLMSLSAWMLRESACLTASSRQGRFKGIGRGLILLAPEGRNVGSKTNVPDNSQAPAGRCVIMKFKV